MRYPVFLLFILLLPYELAAQKALKVKNYGVDQGLPQSTVWDITQDKDGFLWVSTSDGLCRFDGYSFNTYRNNPSDSLSIGGNSTSHMAIDQFGDVWLTHDQGFDKYDRESGKFRSLFRYDGLNKSILNKTIGEDKEGFVWVWIGGEGLMKFNVKTNQRAGKFSMQGNEAWRNHEYSRDAMLDSNGRIWITQGSTSLISFDISTEKFTVIGVGIELGALCAASDSVLLIGTTKGLLRFNTLEDNMERLPYPLTKKKISETPYPTKIIQVNKDEYWIGTPKGIHVYNDPDRSFREHYTSFSKEEDDFMIIQSLFKDKSGNIWIGTNGDGLKRYSPNVPQWKHYRSAGNRGAIVKSIYADGHDLVFTGFYDNGLDIFSKSKGHIRKDLSPRLIPGDMVHAIIGLDSANLFMIFTESHDIYGIYDYKNQTFKNLSAAIQRDTGIPDLMGNVFPVAIPFGQGSIVFNCRSNLIQLTYRNDKGPTFTLLHTFPNEVISSIYVDTDNSIWVGTMRGYYVKKTGNEEWLKGSPDITQPVKTICEDSEGKIWMGTISGLYILMKNGEIEKTLRTGSPLVNDFIYGILRDHQDNMWFSHNKGLTRFDHKKKSFRNFSVADGLQSNEFNTGAYFKSASGELFFGGINGTNSFYPEDIRDNKEVPIAQITRININDKPYLTDTVYWVQKKLTLDYTSNTLGFEFAGLEFTDPAKNQYAWRMSGIDNGWVFSDNNRVTRYANIPPGEYRLEVKASNNDGVWSETPTTLQIEIIPPYWKTWWFTIALGVISITLIAAAAYGVSRQRYRRKLFAQEAEQRFKLEEMKRLQNERNRISRDLHDNVGSMVSFVSTKIDWVLKHKNIDEGIVDDLQQVKENAHDIMSGLRETIWTLHDNVITNTDLADKLKVYIKSHLLIPYHIQDDIQSEMTMTNEVVLNIYRCCQEVVNNINKHSEASRVDVTFESSPTRCFEMSLYDNGKGLSVEDLNKEDHYGLKNLNLRLQEVGATIEIESSRDKGTRIKIIYG